MNYRHAYHAGNFADVLKHVVLTLVVEHLKVKPQPFRILDTHAGAGLYDLAGTEAGKTGEWQDGIGRLLGPGATPIEEAEVGAIVAPYLAAIRALNPDGKLRRYPGSPLLARRLMRPGDALDANELHVEDNAALRRLLAREPGTSVHAIDGWTTLRSLLPPKERRGLVLVDPPFEQPGEMERLGTGLDDVVKRFGSGILLLWYPIKDPKPIARFHDRLRNSDIARLMRVELTVKRVRGPEQLAGTGLVVLNPPFTLEEKLGRLLPFLARRLAQGTGGGWRVDWLSSVK